MKCYKNIIVIICFFVFACVKVAWADEVTFTYSNFSGQGTEGTGSSMSATIDGVTVSATSGYATATHVRIYSSSTLTISIGSGVITKVVFTATSTKYNKLSNVSWGNTETGTWTGSSSSIIFNANGQTRLTTIVVTYTVGASHTLSSSVYPTLSGSVSLSSTSVSEGGTATATATQNSGYAFDHWSISGTGSSLSSTSTNPTTVTMGTANATVTAHFTALSAYTVTFNAGTGTCATASLPESVAGAGVVLPSATAPTGCDPEYHFYGWATSLASETSTPPAIVGTAGDTYLPTANTTLYAVYVAGGYEKVSSNLSDWGGTYLIVYEDGSKAFNGSLTTLDALNNYIDISISGNTIASNLTTDASSFVITKTGDNYTIKSSSGYYIGRTGNSNGMNTNLITAYSNSISYGVSESVNILSSGGAYLRFNDAGDQKRFRYYKSDTYTAQQAIQLYRRSATYGSTPSCTCPTPSDFTASNITTSSAYLSWTANGTESRWQVVVSGTELVDPSSGAIHLVGATNYTATGLSPLTTYYAYVRAKCDEDDFSGWRMVQFETPCLSQILTLNNTSVTIAPSDYVDLEFEGNASTGAITWTTSNAAVATVASNGRVTAVAEGHCVITGALAQESPYCEATLSCNIHVATDDCARVGWGTSNTPRTGTYYNSSNQYSYTQQLYTATEIRMAGGNAGSINSIKVKHKGTGTTISDIYMTLTTQGDLETDYVSFGFIQVAANKTINYVDGWTEITLTTPFQWDGESNIVVAFNNRCTALGTSSGCLCHELRWTYDYDNQYLYRSRYYYSGSAISLDASSKVPNDYTAKSESRSDMKFCITECANPVDAYFNTDELIVALSGGSVATSLTVNPSEHAGAITYFSDNTDVVTVNATTGEITPVAEGTATIVANVAANGTYCSANAYLNVTVCNCPVAGDEQYQVGNLAQQDYTCAPVDNTKKYGYRQIIYPSNMLSPGTIHSIAFNYAYANDLTEKNNVDIYMTHTEKNEFDSKKDWITAGLTLVYSGPMDCTSGWNKFNLQTPFEYNGCDNLVVAIDDNSNNYNSENGGNRDYYKFYTSTSTKNVMIYYRHDTHDANALNPREETYPYEVLSANLFTNHYPDVKFCITPSASVAEHVHTLSYDVTTNCTGAGATVTPTSVSGETASYANVTTIVPSCSTFVGFKEWNTAADGSGIAYHAGDRVNLSCNDVILYAIYSNEVQGESSCENAVAFCNGNSLSFAVSEGYGENYGNFCAYFNSPGTWWYMQIDEPGDIYMTVASTAGDVDMACWGPFNNKTCDLSDLTDNGANGWYTYNHADEHYTNTDATPTLQTSTPICNANTLARPSGNLVDYGGSNSAAEYLQIVNAQHGDYYMILVANYANRDGYITFTQTGGDGRASCDVVTNCDITSISASTECTSSNSYKVSGEVAFRDAPTDGTLTVALGSDTLTFTPPFASPIAYEFTGLTPNGVSMNITATFESSTVNCSKTSSYSAPSKSFCEEIILPVTLVRLRGECNGKRALISWTTASERNNDYFVVERSDDAVNFVEVGRVAGAGNSIEMLSYNYADYSIRTGENYYRLTQVDYDGTRTTSEIIEVHCSGNVPLGDPDVYVYPNPFGDELTVHLVNFGDVAAHIQVYDMLGRMLFERTADDTEVVLQLGALPDAAYTVRVSTADFVVNKKVVKNN